MNNLNNQQVLGGFIKALVHTDRVIPYNPHFMDHEARLNDNTVSFMPAIKDLQHRVTLNPGEWATSYAEHPNPKWRHTSNVLLMRGTEYGLILMFGPKSQYDQRDVKVGNKTVPQFVGPTPTLHATAAFTMAMVRHFKRIGKPISLIGAAQQALEWIFSDNFAQDLAEQAVFDQAAGIALGDGLPPKERPQRQPKGKSSQFANVNRDSKSSKPKPNHAHHTTQSKHATAAPSHPTPNQVMEKQRGTELHAHPMDIMPCRANGFQGRQATEAEKADFAVKQSAGIPIGEAMPDRATHQQYASAV